MLDKPIVNKLPLEHDRDFRKARLARECAELDPAEEQAMAEEGRKAITSSGSTRTDWARVDALLEGEIDTSDIPLLTEDEMARRFPSYSGMARAMTVEVAIDEDLLAWFQAQGPDYPQWMQAALRIYAEAHRASAG